MKRALLRNFYLPLEVRTEGLTDKPGPPRQVRIRDRMALDSQLRAAPRRTVHVNDDAAREAVMMPSSTFDPLQNARHTCAYRKSHPAILMVQSTQDRAADDIPGPLNAARDRGIFVQ